jgi:phenylpyruvate tautomerase PptA (4-oxalocrotonate tautomerase family)
MPFYQVFHSYPLSKPQKTRFAEAITKLHSHTFKTPSLFVNVLFHSEDASNGDYYMAGNVRVNATNRILAMVRTSEKRTKADFDALAEKLENEWYDTVSGEKVCFRAVR